MPHYSRTEAYDNTARRFQTSINTYFFKNHLTKILKGKTSLYDHIIHAHNI